MLTLLLALAYGQVCLAANVPVYLEGERVAQGLEEKGSTYLPMRVMFEIVGAEVEWDEAAQKITAQLPNGDILVMQVGNKEVSFTGSNGEGFLYLEQPPFVRQGVTYVPVRFIANYLLGYDLDWRDNGVWLSVPRLSYTTASGEKFELNQLDGTVSKDGQELGKVAMPTSSGWPEYRQPSEFKLDVTPAGNYILQINGIGSGALTFNYKLVAFIPQSGGDVQTCLTRSYWTPIPEPFQQGDNLWLPDDDGSISIKDSTGEVTKYEGDANGLCWWTDGRFRLLGNGHDFDLYDSQNQKLVDLSAELITAGVKAEANEFLRSTDSSRNDDDEALENNYWSYLGYSLPYMDPIPNLRFDKDENGALYFTLLCSYFAEDEEGGLSMFYKEYPLVYQLPE